MRFFEGLTKSFGCAVRGIGLAIRHRNLQIMLVFGVAVVILAVAYDVSGASWAILLLCIGAVLGAEILNTSIEILADRVEASFDRDIRDTKDLAAGAVLLVSVVAAVTGIIVLWPYVTR